jgi:hypothetical protein
VEERELDRQGAPRLTGSGRRVTVAVTALAVLAGLALPVLAARLLAVDDPNDTAGLLDVHEVRFRDPSGAPPAWTVITFEEWTPRQLWDRGYVLLYLDTTGSPDPDYHVLVRTDRHGLSAGMWREGSEHRLFDVDVRKRGSSGVEVVVPLRRLVIGEHRSVYRWSVRTVFTGGPCHRTCQDAAPDDSMVEQPLPGASPTPTSS